MSVTFNPRKLLKSVLTNITLTVIHLVDLAICIFTKNFDCVGRGDLTTLFLSKVAK